MSDNDDSTNLNRLAPMGAKPSVTEEDVENSKNALASDSWRVFSKAYANQLSMEAHELSARLADQQKRFDEERKRLYAEFEDREKTLISRNESLSVQLSNREATLERRMAELEERTRRKESDLETMRKQIEAEKKLAFDDVRKRTAEIQERVVQFEAERERYTIESQERLKTISTTFVSETVTQLTTRETKLSQISFWWSIAGGASLTIGLAIIAVVSYLSVIHIDASMSWSLLTFYTLKGIVLATVIGLLARYASIQGGNYMTEALRTVDRIHAIKFGQFFVETYGSAADWEQVKLAFSNWNGQEKHSWSKEFDAQDIASSITQAIEKLREPAQV